MKCTQKSSDNPLPKEFAQVTPRKTSSKEDHHGTEKNWKSVLELNTKQYTAAPVSG